MTTIGRIEAMQDQGELLFIEEILRGAGTITLASFGKRIESARKQEPSQIVTEIDIATEKYIIQALMERYPESSIVAEESGFVQRDLGDVWIIDPIDGTSNFASGIPWFGVMMAHIVRGKPVASGIFLPVSNEMYLAEIGKCAYRNSKKIIAPRREELSDMLVAYGTDGSSNSLVPKVKGELYAALLQRVLNLRTTNSAVDYVYAAEGRLGGLIALENRIWDIAPLIPIATEAGCVITDIHGETIDLRITSENVAKNYAIIVANPQIHAELVRIVATVLYR